VTPPTVPVPVYPVADRYINVQRETVYGTPATTSMVTIPVAGFSPEPKVNPIEDKGLRGAMTSTYNIELGGQWNEVAIPESPLFGDTIGHVLFNLFGDYTATGTAGTPTWTTSAALTPGEASIPVSTGAVATAGTFVQVGTTTTAEVVTVGTGSTTTSIVLAATSPLRFSHLSGITVTPVTAPFTHVFTTLNPASSIGNVGSQPPSHTFLDRNQVIGTPGYSDVYPYGCFSQVKLTGNTTGFLSWEGTLTAWPQTTVSAAPTAAISTVPPIPAWRGTSTIQGSAVNDISEWAVTFTRVVEPIVTVDGNFAPYVIARGPLDGSFDIKYDPALDESALNYMLNNTQPTLAWTTTNGLSGASEVSFGFAAQIGAYTDAKLVADKTLFGYDVTGMLVGNSTNVGNSGGYGVATVTLINAYPGY
jgi:hypothetical protein